MSNKILKSGVIVESVAKVLVINEKDEALVLTVGEYEGRPDKSFQPDLPGGQVEVMDGETELVGVVREAEEEAGIVLRPEDLELVYTGTDFYPDENKSVSRFLYVVRLDHTPGVAISWEHADYEWVALDGLLEAKAFRPFYKKAIEYAITHKLI